MRSPASDDAHGSRSIAVDLDLAVYRLAAIKKAAYRFGDRCHVHIATQETQATVTLSAKTQPVDLPHVAGEFCNEVLDQELREVVAQETEGIRNLILAQAFSAVSLIDEHGDEAEYQADPLNIASSVRQKANP